MQVLFGDHPVSCKGPFRDHLLVGASLAQFSLNGLRNVLARVRVYPYLACHTPLDVFKSKKAARGHKLSVCVNSMYDEKNVFFCWEILSGGL